MTLRMSYGWLAESGISASRARSSSLELQFLVVLQARGLGEVVGGQEVEQFADELDGVGLVRGQVGGGAGAWRCACRAPPRVLHVHSSPVTVLMTSGPVMNMCRGLVHHDHVVGQGGGVGRAAGGRAHDEGDLRDDAGGVDVVAEDVREHRQRGDPSWMRAPPPSRMPTTGQPLRSANSWTLTIFSPLTWLSEPP